MACGKKYEKRLRACSYALIAGTDEVGRGALAGPVVAAAVILNLNDVPRGIDDSKKLTKRQRERLADEIARRAVTYSVSRVEPDEIDRINILQASLLAMRLSVKGLQPPADYVLIDGRNEIPGLHCPQLSIVKGDSLSVSIAAASILAKVSRDRWMSEYEEEYPGYGFASHVGYSTQVHQEAISRLGPSAIHRMSFRGVQSRQLAFDL
ncbi:MAG TPA: ribonuclease HII [Blastocatellia bacterium]|nr:ribonuclease HII [Blastocatellia bacterium]